MPYSAGDVKWGTPTLGTASGTVTWSADYVTSLNYGSSFSASDFDAALMAAFDKWESVASIDFQMVASGGDVQVGTASYGGSVAGKASYSFDGNPGLSEIFNGTVNFNSDMVWSPYGGSGGVDFYAVALHEIGHIIGLGHVNDPSEIMNPTVFADDLGNGDIAGAQFLYGRDPGDASAPTGQVNASDPTVGVSAADGGGSGGAGLLLGLLAALLGLVFGGGMAAGAFVAASRASADDDDDGTEPHDDHIEEGPDGLLVHSHDVYVGDLPLPSVAFDDGASACGCFGPCECHLNEAGFDLVA